MDRFGKWMFFVLIPLSTLLLSALAFSLIWEALAKSGLRLGRELISG
jgi:quinol-cytochrome oxidoreductase complex cytochrome b subunit